MIAPTGDATKRSVNLALRSRGPASGTHRKFIVVAGKRCGGLGGDQCIKEGKATTLHGTVGIEEHGGRPCLLSVPHWMTAFTVHPFRELPVSRIAFAIGIRKRHQELLRFVLRVVTHKRGHMEAPRSSARCRHCGTGAAG